MGLRALLSSGLTDIYIVVQPEDPLDWISRDLLDNAALHIVRSHNATFGMSYSLRCGLEAATDEKTCGVFIMLADQPFINKSIITKLISTFNTTHPSLDYVASTSNTGVLTPPVVLARSMFGAVQQLKGDVGARKLLSMPQYQGTSVHYDDPLLLYDVDTQEDWLSAVAYYSKMM